MLNNIGKHLRVWSDPDYEFTEENAELARICDLAVRDELHIPLVLDRETGSVIWNTRLRGCQVVFQSTGNVDIPAAPFCQFIQETFPLLPPGSEITVTISTLGESRVMVNLAGRHHFESRTCSGLVTPHLGTVVEVNNFARIEALPHRGQVLNTAGGCST